MESVLIRPDSSRAGGLIVYLIHRHNQFDTVAPDI
jgi:hypothetical protein